MDKLILKILSSGCPEVVEAQKGFREGFLALSYFEILKSIFYPIKTFFKKAPSLSPSPVVFDCSVLEKYKRMSSLLETGTDFILHCADISTSRNQIFYQQAKGPKVYFRAQFSGYFSMLPKLIGISFASRNFSILFNLVFFCKAAQDLIHYRNLFGQISPRLMVTANEDSWNSGLLAKLCRELKITTINVMHGRVYPTQQFYDYSIVYGKQARLKVQSISSPQTKVICLTPPDVATLSRSQKKQLHSIVYFDQPFLPPIHTEKVRNEILNFLSNLSKENGLTVSIKSHPTLAHDMSQLPAGIRYLENISVKEALAKCDLAISYFSTVGLEAIASGVPTVYLNLNNVLDDFLQIKFLTPSAPTSFDQAKRMILDLGDLQSLENYLTQQQTLLREEYDSSETFKVNDLLT